MLRKKYLKVLAAILTLALLLKVLTLLCIDPLIRKKTEAVITEKLGDYNFKIEKVHFKLLSSGIKGEGITFISKKEHGGHPDLTGEIESVNITRISILKALFTKDIKIRKVLISNTTINGEMPFAEHSKLPVIFPMNVTIGDVILDNTNLSLTNSLNVQSYQLKQGKLQVYNLHLIKNDTLSSQAINRFDFNAAEASSVKADSMYSFRLSNIDYSINTKILSADSFFVHPNYKDYNFTSRYKFQKDRIEAAISDVEIKDFNAEEYIMAGSLTFTNARVGNMNLNVFRDKRKEFNHVKRPVFQELIYGYAGIIRIDTIVILNGNIIYTEHAEKAREQGQIAFTGISAEIFNLSNDSIFKTKKAYMELKCNALLMGKSKLKIQLKSKIFDEMNTFTVNGRLSEMEISDMNSFLENSVLIYATSGRIASVDFNFTANDSISKGSMKMLYNGLNIAVKNKNTDDTTAIVERVISNIVNLKVLDANPSKGEEVRIGIISYQRDPEKFLFSYFAKSFLSGMKSSLLKTSKSK